jgi:hypothetical protein
MSKTITKKIGAHEFRMARIPVFDALEIAGNLQRVFGPALASMSGTMNESVRNDPAQLSIILMESAEALGRYLDGPTLRDLAKMLIREDSLFIRLKGTKEFVACGPSDYEDHVDDVGEMIELLKLILQHNFKEFFSKAAALITANLKSKQSATVTETEAAATESTGDPLDN